VGWANVLSTGSISGFAIFRFIGPSGVSEGTVPLQSTRVSYSKITVPYDNTANFQTGVALANLSSSPVTVTATIWDQSGSQVDLQSFTLLPNGHAAFNIATQWTATDEKQGIIVFESRGGGLTGLGPAIQPVRNVHLSTFDSEQLKTNLAPDWFRGLGPYHAVKLRLECP
jgi:hypothetical protein